VKENILKAHGVFLITGPTGSGKSTTLYSILSLRNTTEVNIVTLEDPVEYFIEGVNQSQINPDIGLTFASGLRSILRQDPNIVMVGEIRDEETAELAVHAALTGHLVFSTLHTNNAVGAIPRLVNMGIEPFCCRPR
jgi:type II secretory ATPase GspE/PulE/Tfp pilus assembly ATPase PilB-like protein